MLFKILAIFIAISSLLLLIVAHKFYKCIKYLNLNTDSTRQILNTYLFNDYEFTDKFIQRYKHIDLTSLLCIYEFICLILSILGLILTFYLLK